MTYPSEQQAEPFFGGGSIQHMYDQQTGKLTTEGETLIAQALDLIQAAAWTNAEAHGFHQADGRARDFGLVTALLHSEASEAFESYRANEPWLWFNDKQTDGKHPDPYNPDGSIRKAEGVFAEFADLLIRLGDSSEELQRDGVHASLAEAFIFKFRYNLSRPFKHGKIA